MPHYCLLESLSRPRDRDEPSADRVLLTADFVAVIDGSTSKPWDPPDRPDGAAVADAVAAAIAHLPRSARADHAVSTATAAVRRLWQSESPTTIIPACATFAALSVARSELWRVGDQWLIINGEVLPPPGLALERQIAAERARVLVNLIREGADVASLRVSDPGRSAVMPKIAELGRRRNSPDGSTFGAIDGFQAVPILYIEVIPLSRNSDVVLATDGYPDIAPTLEESERLLASRTARDPLMIEEPPATKGVAPEADSYDDRSYVRVLLQED